MRSPESLKELADPVGAEADQLNEILRSAIAGVPPVVALEERVARIDQAMLGVEILSPLCDKLDALQMLAERARDARERFLRALKGKSNRSN